jgi:hypothetical protein
VRRRHARAGRLVCGAEARVTGHRARLLEPPWVRTAHAAEALRPAMVQHGLLLLLLLHPPFVPAGYAAAAFPANMSCGVQTHSSCWHNPDPESHLGEFAYHAPNVSAAACVCAANCTATTQCVHWHIRQGRDAQGQPSFPWVCDLRTSEVWAGQGTCERDTNPARPPPPPPGPPAPPPPGKMLACNASALAPGAVLTLTKKLDQSGSCGSSACPPANHWPCALAGPAEGDPATIILPPNDCALHAAGDVTLSGRIIFVAGQAHDCCHDGEGHGSIMCTDSGGNITIALGAIITVKARSDDPEDSIGPGGFHADGGLTVHGVVNASLLRGQRLTGRNGLLAGNGGSVTRARDRVHWGSHNLDSGAQSLRTVHVAATGVVVVRGGASYFGNALAGGDAGVRVDGIVECSDFSGGDGGCINAGQNFTLGPTGVVRVSNGTMSDNGGAINGGDMVTFEGGLLVARNIHVKSSGGVLTGSHVTLRGNATIMSWNVRAEGGSSVVACSNMTLHDKARIEDHYGWGGDGGAIGISFLKLHDDSSIFCEGSYADICGGCLSADIVLAGNSSVVARNTTAKVQGGALCGQYPNQNLTMSGTASVHVTVSRAIGMRGGAIFSHDVTLSESSQMWLQQTSSPCGAAIASLDAQNLLGGGYVRVNGSSGATLHVVNAQELNATTLGCLNIEANLVDQLGKVIEQPCSGCAAPNFPPSRREACKCGISAPRPVQECCAK